MDFISDWDKFDEKLKDKFIDKIRHGYLLYHAASDLNICQEALYSWLDDGRLNDPELDKLIFTMRYDEACQVNCFKKGV